MRLKKDLFSWLFVKSPPSVVAVPALKMSAFAPPGTETSSQLKQITRTELAPAFTVSGVRTARSACIEL